MAALFVSSSAFAAQPYHIELEADPALAFPYLRIFGTVEIHVYPSGVRTEALWLNAFSKNGTPAVTVANPLTRTYSEVPVSEIAAILAKLAGAGGIERETAPPSVEKPMAGKVGGVSAMRYRLRFGPQAWVDVWTTHAIPENPQLRAIIDQLIAGISPPTAAAARTIKGTPLYVELNFRRFKKVPLVRLKKLTHTSDDEKDALELGPLYMRTGGLEKVFEK